MTAIQGCPVLLGTDPRSKAAIGVVALSEVVAEGSRVGEEVVPLRPPRSEIPPFLWERGEFWIAVTMVAVVFVGLVLWLRWRDGRKQERVTPEDRAKRALDRLRGLPEDGRVLGEVARVVRDYFVTAFELPGGEMTDRETTRLLFANERLGRVLAEQAAGLLGEWEQGRFRPGPGPGSPRAVERAEELIVAAGQRRREVLNARGVGGEGVRL